MKIIHIINSLRKGGAEGNLYRLCKYHKKKYKNKVNITIITLIADGNYVSKLKKVGVNIFSLKMSQKIKFFDFIRKILQLRKLIKKINPDVIQSWMYHSNFITLFLPRIFYARLFWNVRHSELSSKISKNTTILLSIICGILSQIVPKKIIYCSLKSMEFHKKKHFYSKKKTVLIDNGYDENTYFPSSHHRLNFRKKNKIKKLDIILGYAGRYAKQKNIPTLLYSFSKIIKVHHDVYLFMAGNGINKKNKMLSKLIYDYNIEDRVILLDQQKNLLNFYNGIDLLVLISHSESFSNVLAESMLCSTPVLSSDSGCSKKIINSYGFVINKNTHLSVVNGLKKSIDIIKKDKKKWNFLKENTRIQIKNNFSIEKMAFEYLKIWTN